VIKACNHGYPRSTIHGATLTSHYSARRISHEYYNYSKLTDGLSAHTAALVVAEKHPSKCFATSNILYLVHVLENRESERVIGMSLSASVDMRYAMHYAIRYFVLKKKVR